jgi:hypothetical protein
MTAPYESALNDWAYDGEIYRITLDIHHFDGTIAKDILVGWTNHNDSEWVELMNKKGPPSFDNVKIERVEDATLEFGKQTQFRTMLAKLGK